MPSYQVGPSEIDALSTGVHVNLGDLYSRRDWHVDRMRETHDRVKTVTNVAIGEWYTEWPDLTTTPEAPTIANTIEVGIAHWSSIFGAILPSVRVPIHATVDRGQGKRGARKRERRIRELWRTSNLNEISALFGADYAGAGYAIGMVWTDFGEPDPAKRNPYIMRIDPRHAYVAKDNLGNITEILVARKISITELEAMWGETNPDFLDVFSGSKDEDVEEWFWFTKNRVRYVIADVSKKGRNAVRSVSLVDQPNDLGFVPAVEVVRPTFDGQRRGLFDQNIHILRTMQRLMLLTISSTEENSFPAIGSFDVANPGEFGPGAVMEYLSENAKIERLGPANHFDIKDLIGRLDEHSRLQASLPQQLFGEPGASINSARGIAASMGGLDARLAVAHKQFERMWSQISGMLLAVDEIWCDGEKTILGDGTDDEDAEKFIPSRDINGAWVVECVYGIGAGSDPANIEVRLNMHLGGGLISKETARMELPFLRDPDGEPLKIFRETLHFAVSQGLVAQAGMGDFTLVSKAFELLDEEDMTFEQVLEKLMKAVAQAPEAPAAPGAGGSPMDPLAALQGGESLARGGIPGNAEQAPPPSLPPLSSIMGQDSKMVA